jgi:hypothetical protein
LDAWKKDVKFRDNLFKSGPLWTGPNESFWGFLTQKVNEEGRVAKTEQHLIYTESKMKELDRHFVKNLLEGV